MSKQGRHAMQCPGCGSHYTQAVSLAYSQSIRTGYNGHQTISEFGKELEPPPARSEIGIPMIVAATMFGITFFLLPEAVDWFDAGWIKHVLSSYRWRIGIAATLALFIMISHCASAMAYNLSEHSEDMDDWDRSVICRRCGEQFQR